MDLRKAFGMESEHVEENAVNFEIFLTEGCRVEADGARGWRVALLEHLLPSLEGYIWQCCPFDLRVTSLHPPPWQQQSQSRDRRAGASSGARRREQQEEEGEGESEAGPPLWGRVEFGDNLEDEWFVVWLLMGLTRAFPVAARVWDNDGDFLLIEAAYSLPKWLKPETAKNRVWLYGGSLHILPLPRAVGDPLIPARPSRQQALSLLCVGELDTQASPKVLAPILQRLAGFPQRAREQMHSVRLVLPSRVAHLLRADPQLVAPAVAAFHYRDVDDMRAAMRMAHFPPHDMVPLRAPLTRCLYAQLALQEFQPVRTYPMPMPSDPQFKASELGMKLTAGFEMLAASAQEHAMTTDVPAEAPSEGSLPEGPDWQAFLARLAAGGFFSDHAPGSQQHGALLRQAAGRFWRVQAYRRRAAELAAPVARMQQLLQEPLAPLESYPPFEELPPDDSEAWLREGAAALDSELQQRQQEMEKGQGRRGGIPGGADLLGQGEEDFDPEALAARLRQFVELAGCPESAEGAGGEGALDLDEARFAAELARVLRAGPGAFGGAGDEVSSDEGSSFYSGSDSDSDTEEGSSDEGEEEPPWAGTPTPPAAQQPPPCAARAGGAAAAVGPAKQDPAAAVAAAPAPWGQREQGEHWEVATATDSDDEAAQGRGSVSSRSGRSDGEGEVVEEEGEDFGAFMDAYSQVMQGQLAPTTLGRSFARAVGVHTPGGGGHPASMVPVAATGNGTAAGPSRGVPGRAAEGRGEGLADGEGELQPVDIDLNVVEGLLASYYAQEGLPGPASNLAGLLGIPLPPPPQSQPPSQ